MSKHEDWHEAQLSAEVREFIDATRAAHLDERAAVLKFASMLCSCTPWYDWKDPEPAQLDCVVHTTIMFDAQGGWI